MKDKPLANAISTSPACDHEVMRSKASRGSQGSVTPSGYIRGKEAAEYLGVSIRTLHAWKARAIIPCHKMAHRVCLYRKVDLDKAVGRFRLNAIGETSLRKRTY